MKKLINSPDNVVREMLEGVVALSTASAILADENIVIQSGLPEPRERNVAVLSGGGSGHEPAHAGYVGTGTLTAAIAGDVFTSPSADAVLAGIRMVSGPAGALLIVKNYTGDRLNFGLAAELARAEGIPVEIVVVADDVALRETVPADRRRGIAGTVLVHKVAGAAAGMGLPLGEVARITRAAAERVSSMGISLGSCTLPSVGKPGFSLGENEIEIGLGIHGEPGVRRMTIASADEMTALIIDAIEADGKIERGNQVVMLVNGLGSTPPMELAIVTRAALAALDAKGINVVRAWTGTFLSALDMPGFSVSLMPVDERDLVLLDSPTDAQSWPRGGPVNRQRAVASVPRFQATADPDGPPRMSASGRLLRDGVSRVAKALLEAEDELARLDAIAGDGDLGASMRRGAEALLSLPEDAFSTVSNGLSAMGNALRKAIAGSSGPFYATALMRASRQLAGLDQPTAKEIAEACSDAVQAISELGGAKPGDRTMIDALRPAADAFSESVAAGNTPLEAWRVAVEAAASGMQATCNMYPRLGRASYLGQRAIGSPDAGAAASVVWLKAVAAKSSSHEEFGVKS